MTRVGYQEFYRRRLPHFQPQGATIFVTFRLAGSLPKDVVERLKAELNSIKESGNKDELGERRWFGRYDSQLDQLAHGPTWLGSAPIAQIVSDSLHMIDGDLCAIVSYCIMPNHVHLIATPLADRAGTHHSIAAIMQLIKGSTARQANLILGRTGAFWQHESYDHVIRGEEELGRVLQYVVNNPLEAGLVQSAADWPWIYVRQLAG